MSKLLLIGSDALAVLALPSESFGAFALLQGLILSGAVISAWGGDQAAISVIGRTRFAQHNVVRYHLRTSVALVLRSALVAITLAAVAMGSRITFTPPILLTVVIITMLEAQMILNAAALRASMRPYLAVLFLDGIRNLALFGAAWWVYSIGGGFEILLYAWLAAAAFCCLGGTIAGRTVLSSGPEDIPEADQRHASAIARFSGLWSVTQFVISRLVLVFSAYILSPDDLGIVAFFLKLMVVFTFLQTVTVQAVAPVIGRVSQLENIAEAKRVYATTTFLLAAAVTPLVGACLLTLERIMTAFSIQYAGAPIAVLALLMAQAFNIGTGIIGQFIIHFGYARDLLIVSAVGAVLQGALLLLLGTEFGAPGVFAAYSIASILLTLAKNGLAARKVGFHGLAPANLLILCAIAVEVLTARSFVGMSDVHLTALLFAHALFCLAVCALAGTRSPEVRSWLKRRLNGHGR